MSFLKKLFLITIGLICFIYVLAPDFIPLLIDDILAGYLGYKCITAD